jgi:heme oxygenase
MPTTAHPIMPRLRDETADLHKQAEEHPLQKAMATGRLPVAHFAAYLGQVIHMHRRLELDIPARRDAEPRLGVVEGRQFGHARRIEHDWADLTGNAETAQPLETTTAAVQAIDADAIERPIALLGSFYVLEGSMNGNRFIAKPVAKACGLEAPTGLRYLLSYGEEQPAVWKAFKERMNALTLSDEEQDLLVDRAKGMFQTIYRVSDAIVERMPLEAPTSA